MGVISTSNIARWRVIPAIHNSRNGEVVAVASRREESARAFADQNHIPRALGSYEALIEDPGIDAIYIPLPIVCMRNGASAVLRQVSQRFVKSH